MTAPVVTWEQLVDGMLDELRPLERTEGGSQPIRTLARYVGEFAAGVERDPEKMRAVAGRCPAVLIEWGGEKDRGLTVGRRSQRLEETLIAICVTDTRRSRDDRKALWSIARQVRQTLVNKRLGLAITLLRYTRTVVVVDSAELYALGVVFTTDVRWLPTVDAPAPSETLERVQGTVTNSDEPPGTLGELAVDTT